MLPCIFFRGDVSCYRRISLNTYIMLHWIVSFLYVYRWVVHVSWGFVSRFAHSHKNCMHSAGLIFCCPILHYYIPSNWTTSIDLNQPGYYIYKYWWGYDLVAAGNLQASKQANMHVTAQCMGERLDERFGIPLSWFRNLAAYNGLFYLADSNETMKDDIQKSRWETSLTTEPTKLKTWRNKQDGFEVSDLCSNN